MEITIDMIKELREKTGCGIMDCRSALQNANGDFDKALEELREKGLKKAEKRANREASEGRLEVYIHSEGRLVVLVEINSETDFVAKSDAFKDLAHEIALQIAASSPKYISEADIPVRQYFRGSNPGEEQRAIGNSGRKKPVGTIRVIFSDE